MMIPIISLLYFKYSLWVLLTLESSVLVTIPPLLEENGSPPKGTKLYTVTHDPDQTPDPVTLPCRADGLPPPS